MMKAARLSLASSPVLVALLSVFCAVASNGQDIVDLKPYQFYEGMESGLFDVVGDVRTPGEWKSGHIEGATHVETTTLPAALQDCKGCNIALYCRSGARAGAALRKLRSNGFTGKLYNGGGINAWKGAGYKLSMSSHSATPPCMQDGGTCGNALAVTPGSPQKPVDPGTQPGIAVSKNNDDPPKQYNIPASSKYPGGTIISGGVYIRRGDGNP